MTKSEKLLHILSIKGTESKLIAFLIGYSFCMGGAMAVYYTVVVSGFLTTFGPRAIPDSYIVGGVVVFLLGWLVSRLGKNVRFAKRSERQLFSFLLSVAFLTVAYHITRDSWLIFTLFIWNRVFVLVHGVTFWAAVSKMFDLQQSKRLYSLINSGEVLASVIAYFSVPLLIRHIPLDFLLYAVVILLTACCLIQHHIHRRFLGKSGDYQKAKPEEQDSGQEDDLKRKSFNRNLFFLALIPVFSLLYVEYLFFVESRETFPDREVLAGFLGLFFGICAVFELIIKTFLYQKLIARYGLKAGIILLPALLIFSIAVASLYGYGLSADTIVFFAFIVIARFFMSAVRKSVSEPAFQVLYQAIPIQKRLSAQNKIEGRAKSAGGFLAGILLWLLLLVPDFSNVDLTFAFLPVPLLWLLLSLQGQKLYRQLILERLNQLFDRKKATQPIPRRPDRPDTDPFKDHGALVRMEKARALGDSGGYNAYQELIPLLQDPSTPVRRTAIDAAGKLAVYRPQIHPYLLEQLYDEKFSETAGSAILKAGETLQDELSRRLAAGTDTEAMQLKLLALLAEIPGPKRTKTIRNLLSGGNRHLTEKAINALLSIGYEPNASERNRLLLMIEEYLRFYTRVIALCEDLSLEYNQSSTLMKALIIEREKLTVFIFSILALLYNHRFSLISRLIRSRDPDLRGLLIEICDMELSGHLKEKAKVILETDSAFEILNRLKNYYPQFTLTSHERLYELVNQDFTRFSIWTKALALKELAQKAHAEYPDILPAFAVSQHHVLSQTAGYYLRKNNENRFNSLFTTERGRSQTNTGKVAGELALIRNEDDLLVCRLSRIRLLEAFQRAEDSLLETIVHFGRYYSNQQPFLINTGLLAKDDNFIALVITRGTIKTDESDELLPGLHLLFLPKKQGLQSGPDTELYLLPAYLLPASNHRSSTKSLTASLQ